VTKPFNLTILKDVITQLMRPIAKLSHAGSFNGSRSRAVAALRDPGKKMLEFSSRFGVYEHSGG